MNWDSVWQFIRYILVSLGTGSSVVAYFSNANLEAVLSALVAILTAAWGLYVKLKTSPVLDSVIKEENLPSVSSATGAKIPEPLQPEVTKALKPSKPTKRG